MHTIFEINITFLHRNLIFILSYLIFSQPSFLYRRLILYRLKWAELHGDAPEDPSPDAMSTAKKLKDSDDGRTQVKSKDGQELAKLIWEGEVKEASFRGDMQVLKFNTDLEAKEYFEKQQILNYWNYVQSKVLICHHD